MASSTEIGVALKLLTNTLPPPRGISMDKAFDGYVDALNGFAISEINEAIRRYLAAEFSDVSLKFYPRAPELAGIVRRVRERHAHDRAAVGLPKKPAVEPPKPAGETLFQRQWRRWKAGEIASIDEGLHGAPAGKQFRDRDFGGLA